jgi:hypothetical protein
LILAKVVDDILLAGSSADTQSFYTALNSRFKVGRFVCNAFIFNGLHIPQGDDFSIQFNINGFLGMCLPINLSPARRKSPDLPVESSERTAIQSLAGTLNFLGHGVLPEACYVASFLQQQLGSLRVEHLSMENRLLKDLQHCLPRYSILPFIQRGSLVFMYSPSAMQAMSTRMVNLVSFLVFKF